MKPVSQLFAAAVQHHQTGRLPEAEQLYRQILEQDPAHTDALHLLGVIAHQVGRHELAVELIGQSIKLKGDEAHVFNNLGAVYRALQRHDAARSAFERAIELKSEYVGALINLAATDRDLGSLDESIRHYQRAIQLRADDADLLVTLGDVFLERGNLDAGLSSYDHALRLGLKSVGSCINVGNTLKRLRKLNAAIECYRRAIELDPRVAVAHLNLGVVLKEQGSEQEAIDCYRRALQLDPNCAEAFNNLGVAFNDRGDVEQATCCFRRALELKPAYAEASNNLGIALSRQGDLDAAIGCYQQALAVNPRFSAALNNLGIALKEQGRIDEAINSFRQALQLKPRDCEALNHLGAALKSRGLLDEALECCQRSLSFNPDDAATHNHLGNILKDQGHLDQAIQHYRRAVELKPNDVSAHSNLIYTLLFSPDMDQAAIQAEHERWNQQRAVPLENQIRPHTNDRTADRRLRIGYVSPCLRNHVVGRNLIPLFQHHDRQRFEIFCYADVSGRDELTQRFQSLSDRWRNTLSLSDEQLTDLIRDDQIDILVDLTLHMAQHRLLVFARQPAPVQVTFAGYPGTTGVTAIDYRLTDPFLDPPGWHDGFYSEKSHRLSHSFWCYDPLDSPVSVNDLPALKNGYLTFGCLNNFCKINKSVLKAWAKVLNAVHQSRIIILSGEGSHREQTWQTLESFGVTRDRVTFVSHRPRQFYLRYYHEIDIGLDTFPYNGHSTSLDSFWMGVPVITLVGETVVGRAGLCQLMNLGLPELIAETPDQFVEIADLLAEDLPRLVELRSTLRERMTSSPLMNTTGFAKSIESSYAEFWQSWCHRGAG